MSNTVTNIPDRPGPIHLLWGVIARPGRTFKTIADRGRRSWWLPAVLVVALTVAFALASGPIRTRVTREEMQAAQEEMAERMGDQLSPEDLERAQAITASPLITIVFPAVSSVVGQVMGWLIWAGALYLASMALGGRSSFAQIFPVTVWAGLPHAVRSLLQIAYVLTTDQLITNPGLSGLLQQQGSMADAIASPPGTGEILLRALLSRVDLFLIWHLILLVIGVAAAGRLSGRKSLIIVLVVWLLLTALSLIPSLVGGLFTASTMAG